MISIKIETSGFEKVLRLADNISRLPMLLQVWGAEKVPRIIKDSAIKTMQSNGRGNWDKLASATVEDRERKGFPGTTPILIRSGELFTEIRGAGAGITRTTDGLEISMPSPMLSGKYRAHQTGTPGGAPNLPQRPIFNIFQDDFNEMMKELQQLTINATRV